MSLLDDITARGTEIRARLLELLPRHQYPADNKSYMLLGYVSIAREHHTAIWLLNKFGLNGTAFGVVRFMFDAYVRALWINKCATAEQIEQAVHDTLKFPWMSRMLGQIKQSYFGAKQEEELTPEEKVLRQFGDSFFQFHENAWPVLSSYTHSGGLQISRRFTGDKVKANYSDGEIAQALILATVWLLLLAHMFFVSMSRYDEAEETLALLRQFHAAFTAKPINQASGEDSPT
jgi:hypothetical protein